MTPGVREQIDAIWRIESAKVIASLARFVRDVGLAEDLAQDALLAALEQWPESGVPERPGAWLTTVGRRRAIDLLRRRTLLQRKQEELGYELRLRGDMAVDEIGAGLDDDIGDDLLRLMFVSCHTVLSQDARVALTLRLLGGLTTDEIARAFLTPESTIAQRIIRAKRTLAAAKVPFELPGRDELAELAPSPVVELNRAVAVGMAFGPSLGLELVNRLVGEPALARYHLLPAVRGDLLNKLGHPGEARVEFERAAELAGNERERRLLLGRAAACAKESATGQAGSQS